MENNEETKALYKALALFRKNIKQPVKDGKNPYFKSSYVTLEGVIKSVDEAMNGTGLSFAQEVATINGLPSVRTMLMHEDGGTMATEWLSLPLKQSATPQDVGSLITYAKRYQLAGFLGISSDIDDDGNQASQNYRQLSGQQQANYQQMPHSSQPQVSEQTIAEWEQVMADTCQRLDKSQKDVMALTKKEIIENKRFANYRSWSEEVKRKAEITIMKEELGGQKNEQR